MNHKVIVLVSSLLLLFTQTSVLPQSSFQNATLANTQIAQQSESGTTTDTPKKRRSAGPRFIDLQFPDSEKDNPTIYYPAPWLESQELNISTGFKKYKKGDLRAALESFNRATLSMSSSGLPTNLPNTDTGELILIEDLEEYGAIANTIGLIHRDLQEWELSKESLNKALSAFTTINNSLGSSIALNNLGTIYSQLKQPQEALDYHNQALTLLTSNSDRKNEQYTLNKIALTYYELGKKEKSLDYFQQVLVIAKKQNDTVAEGITLNNIGNVYWSLGQKIAARKFYKLALKHLQDNNYELVATVKQNIARNLSLEKISFSCGSVKDIPTTIANTPRGDLPFIRWESSYFAANDFITPQQRCKIITSRLEKNYQNGLKYLTTGMKNRQPVICMTSTNNSGCEEVLFTLKSNSDPTEELQALLNIRDIINGSSSQPLYQSSPAQVYIDLEEYLHTAPSIQESEPLTKRETKQ